MNTGNPQVGPTQGLASDFQLFIVICVLLLVFLHVDHDLRYTLNRLDSGFDLAVTAITYGSIKRRLALIFLGIFSGFLLLKRRNFSFKVQDLFSWLIVIYLFWAVMSLLWAEDPPLVTRRIVVFIILYFAAFSLSMSVPLRQLPNIVLWTSTVYLIIGFLSERLLGTWWLGAQGYRFSGTYHPESQGVNCAMLLLAATAMRGEDRRFPRALSLAIMFVAVVFLVLTKSRGPFVGAMAGFLIYKIYTRKSSTMMAYIYAFAIIFCIAVLIFGEAFFPLLSSGLLLGRQDDQVSELSGRRALWAECIEYAKQRPIGGYGYSGFWNEKHVWAVADSQGWRVASSHSMYIEMVLNLGLVGFAIFSALLIVAWWRARRTCTNEEEEGQAFALSLLTLWLADGLLSTLVVSDGFVTFMLFVVFFGIARESGVGRDRREIMTGS